MSFALNTDFSRVSLGDIDQFTDWERSLGWDIESTQLSPGKNIIGFDHFLFPDLFVGHFHSKQAMYNSFVLPDGIVMLYISRNKRPLNWHEVEFPPSKLGIVLPGRSEYAVLPRDHDCYEFMMSEELILRTGIFPRDYFLETARKKDPCLTLVEPNTELFLRGLDLFFGIERSSGTAAGEAVCRTELYEYILCGLQQIIDNGLEAEDSPSLRHARRADLIPTATEFMAANLAGDLTIDEIASEIGVSYRVQGDAGRQPVQLLPHRAAPRRPKDAED